MEFLGYTYEKPTRDASGKWNQIDMEYPDDKLFNESTGKLIRGMNDDKCRFIVADDDNTRYFVDVLDVRYNVITNTIKLWPHYCKQISK